MPHIFRLQHPDVEKAKEIVYAIIREAGGEFSGRTRLYKAFYLAHIAHWLEQQGILSQYPIARMPKGPGIDQGDVLLAEMRGDGLIESREEQCGPYPENVYSIASEYNTHLLDDADIKAIQRALEWVDNKTGTQLSEMTHEHSRSWINAKNGDVLDVYQDLLSDEEFDKIAEIQSRAKGLVDSVFGGLRDGSSR